MIINYDYYSIFYYVAMPYVFYLLKNLLKNEKMPDFFVFKGL